MAEFSHFAVIDFSNESLVCSLGSGQSTHRPEWLSPPPRHVPVAKEEDQTPRSASRGRRRAAKLVPSPQGCVRRWTMKPAHRKSPSGEAECDREVKGRAG